MNNMISIREAAAQAGKEPETIRRGILQGKLPGTPIKSDAGRTNLADEYATESRHRSDDFRAKL